ncbi:P-II family nitrogen regulator [Leptospira sp. GIMC2001]|uniref:P-II family nitrogen regulator n=1 Tax=Leptospira sp. GIMC2001 TaxID=1513297 RepID=UPI0023498BA3|nr:P-II family nitrogen regulator [Leptospira sp. GIMC2001]WCL50841.1 P-II family nitrogen regulator [Leptospira sp. GIMC2001]
MKKIEAFIKPFQLQTVKQALLDQGITGMTIMEVQGFGTQAGHHETVNGTEYRVDFLPKVLIILVIEDHLEDTVVNLILDQCCTGHIGDGKILVTSIEKAIRIRTREEGVKAIR